MVIRITEPYTENKQENLIDQEVIVGIDFGTTNSLIAMIGEDRELQFFGQNEENIHPSIVEFDDLGNLLNVSKKLDLKTPDLKSANKITISSIKRILFSVSKSLGVPASANNNDKFPPTNSPSQTPFLFSEFRFFSE